MDIDIRTLFVVHALVSMALSALMLVFWRTHRGIPGLGQWTLGVTLLGVTLVGTGLRGIISDFLSIVVANACAVATVAAFWNGIRRFDGRPTRWLGALAVALATAAFSAHHTYVVNDVLTRIVVTSLLLAAGCLLCAHALIRGPARSLHGTAVPAAVLFGLLALTLGVRALATVLAPPAPNLFAPSIASAIHFLVSVVASILVVVALIMMAAQRLQQRIEARNADLEAALATSEAHARELAQSRQQLAVSQRLEAMGQLTGGVAHDFNNLLTIVASSIEMIGRVRADAARVDRLSEVAMRAVSRGQRLTQTLLTFARRDFVKPEVVDPGRLVLEMEPLLRRATGERTELALELGPRVHPVRLDPSRFEVAILNLVLNARDAMPGGGLIVIAVANVELVDDDVRANPDARAGPHVVIAVRDDGTGMPPEVVAKAFEPFFSTKDVGMGSGLGLSQVYGFARGAGGHVTIDSQVGRGTTVRLHLPKCDETPKQAEPRPAAAPVRAVGGDETVLIVEDDLLVLAATAESIAELGYRTLTAATAHEALAHLGGAARIDVLFSDIILPGGMDGTQLVREARRLRPGLKVLLTSGYAGAAATPLPEDLEILSKPYRRAELAAVLRRTVGGAPVAP
jgi:signal transduction histidine kinase